MRDPIEGAEIDRRGTGWAVLAGVVVLMVLAALRPSVFGTLLVILAFFVMIMLHELGHFVMAKRAGMKVTEFFVGFGPRVWSFRRGETEYGLKAFPLGGYCKIIGMTNVEEVAPEDEPRAYRNQGYLARLGVAVAGSAMHFLIALVLVFVVLVGEGDVRGADVVPVVGRVEGGAPAAEAGLREGDRILTVGGTPVETWDDVPDTVRPRAGETVDFVVERGGERLVLAVELADENPLGEQVGYAGIAPDYRVPNLSVPEAAAQTPGMVYDITKESIGALGRIFSLEGLRNYADTVAGREADENDERSGERFISPVGFGRLASQAVSSGWVPAVGLLIAINVFVGVFNMLPLLPFDGGHVAIATYEKIASTIRHRRVQVDVNKLIPLTVAVVGVLAFIFLSSLFLDLTRPLPNPF